MIKRAFTRAFLIWLIPALYLSTYTIIKYGLETPTYLVPTGEH